MNLDNLLGNPLVKKLFLSKLLKSIDEGGIKVIVIDCEKLETDLENCATVYQEKGVFFTNTELQKLISDEL